jgi:hypothetical protein
MSSADLESNSFRTSLIFYVGPRLETSPLRRRCSKRPLHSIEQVSRLALSQDRTDSRESRSNIVPHCKHFRGAVGAILFPLMPHLLLITLSERKGETRSKIKVPAGNFDSRFVLRDRENHGISAEL